MLMKIFKKNPKKLLQCRRNINADSMPYYPNGNSRPESAPVDVPILTNIAAEWYDVSPNPVSRDHKAPDMTAARPCRAKKSPVKGSPKRPV